jgi:hypothetical protein
MIGDQSDIIYRFRSVLPRGWFADDTPILDSLISALSASWTQLYSLLVYARNQSRIATATDFWLDVVADDYFGASVSRLPAESDSSFRSRILDDMIRERATRSAVSQVIFDLTAVWPFIFEPARCADTGSYSLIVGDSASSGGGMAYGLAGGWGSLELPFCSFVRIALPPGIGVSMLPGWTTTSAGYGAADTAFSNPSIQSQVGNEELRQAILSVMPVAVTAWLQVVI